MTYLSSLLRYRNVVLNVLFVAYLTLIQPAFLERLQATEGYQASDPLIGAIILILPLFELVGAYLKLPVSAYYLRHHFSQRFEEKPYLGAATVGCILFPWIFHLLIAVFLGQVAIDMLGISSPGMRGLVSVLVMVAVFVKEAFFVALNNPALGTVAPSKRTETSTAPKNILHNWQVAFDRMVMPPEQIDLKLTLRDALGDLFMLIYSALGWTVLWDANPFFTGSAWGSDLFAMIYFLVIYTVLRSAYLMEEIFAERTHTSRLVSVGSFLIVLVAAMLSVPWR